jgi:hypothetical protein
MAHARHPTSALTGLDWGMSKHTSPGNIRVAVAYLRASKDEQRLSPEAQRAGIEAWAERESICVAAWCVDQGVRSFSPVAQRPALRAALAASAPAPPRFSRSTRPPDR